MDCTHKEQYVARSIFSSWKSLYKMYVLHRNIHNFTNCCEFSSLGNHSLKMPCLWKIWFVGFFNNWSINSKFLPFARLQCHKEKRDIESGDVLHVFLCTVFFFLPENELRGFALIFITALWHSKCGSYWIEVKWLRAAVTKMYLFLYGYNIYFSTGKGILTAGR